MFDSVADIIRRIRKLDRQHEVHAVVPAAYEQPLSNMLV